MNCFSLENCSAYETVIQVVYFLTAIKKSLQNSNGLNEFGIADQAEPFHNCYFPQSLQPTKKAALHVTWCLNKHFMTSQVTILISNEISEKVNGRIIE